MADDNMDGLKRVSADTLTKVPQMSKLDRFGTGMLDPVYGAAQIGARMTPEGAGPDYEEYRQGLEKSVDESVKKREETIKKESPEGVDLMRLGGNVASPMNYVLPIPGMAGAKIAATSIKAASRLALANAATKGMIAGALQPATGENFANEKIKQASWGAIFGAGGSKVVDAASKFVSPVLGKIAKELLARGVQLTPGQMAGPFFKQVEEVSRSLPILGHFIRGAQGRSVESFNKAALNQALDPIGVKIPEAAEAGHEANSYAYLRAQEFYEDLLPKLKFTLSPKFASDMADLRPVVEQLPKAQAEHFESILQSTLGGAFAKGNQIGGVEFKAQVQSQLRYLSNLYRSSREPANQQLAHVIDKTQSIIRKQLARDNPEHAQTMEKLDLAYAMLSRVRDAATRRATSMGKFTPSDLSYAVKNGDKSAAHTSHFKGDALMQEFADWGQTLIPNKLPDSGTTERLLWGALDIGTATGGGALAPETSLAVAPYIAGASALYSKPGSALVRRYVQPGAARNAVGAGINKAQPIAPVAGADIANSVFGLGQ